MTASGLMKAVYRQFHRPTGFWGRLAGTIMAHRGSNQRRNAWTVDLLELAPMARVLEIGFGPGLAIQRMAASVPSGRVVGIDHSAVMIDQAARRNRAAIEAGRVELYCGGLELLDRYAQAFDAVAAINVLHFEQDRVAVLRAIRRVVKPAGRVAITYQPRHRGATRDDALAFAVELKEQFQAAGFTSAAAHTLELGDVPAVCVVARVPADG